MPEPSWTKPERWKNLVDGVDCPLCHRGDRPGVIAELRACVVVVDESVPVRGYCCLILKRHAVELHQLLPREAEDFIADVQLAAGRVQVVTGAIKINYEVHGNVIPHVHMHLIPRYPADPIEVTGRTWHTLEGPVYAPGEFARYVGDLTQALT